MDQFAPETLEAMSRRLEAFETPAWAIDAVLDVELTTRYVIDPCSGTGAIPAALERKTANRAVVAYDVVDWRRITPTSMKWMGNVNVGDWLTMPLPELREATVIMNPPFSKACDFVDRAKALGARKILCFQRQAWWESARRRKWWSTNTPCRIWVCGGRATCWRFDLLDEVSNRPKIGGTTTSHAWYVWERGHTPAALNSWIYPPFEVE